MDIAMAEAEREELDEEKVKTKEAALAAKSRLKDVKKSVKQSEASRRKLEKQARKLKQQGEEELSTKADIERLKNHLRMIRTMEKKEFCFFNACVDKYVFDVISLVFVCYYRR